MIASDESARILKKATVASVKIEENRVQTSIRIADVPADI
jgi:hypothetical protein